MPKIQTCIIDDHPLMLRGLAALFVDHPRIDVVATIQGGRDAARALDSMPELDVAVVDLRMPEVDGFDVIRLVGRLFPAARSLAHTALGGVDVIRQAISCGAHGFVSKSAEAHVLAEGIARVHADGVYFCPQSQKLISSDVVKADSMGLTEREQEILSLLRLDRTNREISEKLFISYSTVRFHIKNIYRKRGATKRNQLFD